MRHVGAVALLVALAFCNSPSAVALSVDAQQPPPLTLAVGQQVTLTASGVDEYGKPVPFMGTPAWGITDSGQPAGPGSPLFYLDVVDFTISPDGKTCTISPKETPKLAVNGVYEVWAHVPGTVFPPTLLGRIVVTVTGGREYRDPVALSITAGAVVPK